MMHLFMHKANAQLKAGVYIYNIYIALKSGPCYCVSGCTVMTKLKRMKPPLILLETPLQLLWKRGGKKAFSHSQALECVIKPTRMCLDCEEKTGAPGAKRGEQHISHPKVHQRKIQRKTPQ